MSKKVTIIGGGPGGYTAAIRLAQLGAEVTLVEKTAVGGTCLNRGCIPTKALVRSAEVFHTVSNAATFGVNVDGFSADFGKMVERKNEIVSKLRQGIMALIKSNKITCIEGSAKFLDKSSVEVTLSESAKAIHNESTLTLTSDYTIIATGSVPTIPPIPGADLPGILTSDSILDLSHLPESLTIIGGGVIGMEFASIFQTLGTKVTVIEALPNILGKIETDIAKRMVPAFKKRGTNIYTDTLVQSITLTSDATSNKQSYCVTAKGKKGEFTIESEALLISTGRKPYTEGLNLSVTEVALDKNFITIDSNGQTNIENIYAIGDVTGGWMLAHAAAHQGITAAHSIMGQFHTAANPTVPSCIFTFPEVASAGLTEAEVKESEQPYKTSKFMFGANGKALCLGESEGFVKIISSTETGKILGVHIMGPHASDLIHEAMVAIEQNITVKEFSDIIHAHPTLSEAVSEAVMGIDGLAIHSAGR